LCYADYFSKEYYEITLGNIQSKMTGAWVKLDGTNLIRSNGTNYYALPKKELILALPPGAAYKEEC